MAMRILINHGPGPRAGEEVGDRLAEVYQAGSPWLRATMVNTVDGSAVGESGLSGSINNAPDHAVYQLLRATSDAVVVGAGTARAEGYRPDAIPIVVVSARGSVPEALADGPPGMVLLATCRTAPGRAAAEATLGRDNVLILGTDHVDLGRLRPALAARGRHRLLAEGGPRLLGALLTAGTVDELCATSVPLLVGGDGPRITAGPALRIGLELGSLIEADGTLLARWLVRPGSPRESSRPCPRA